MSGDVKGKKVVLRKALVRSMVRWVRFLYRGKPNDRRQTRRRGPYSPSSWATRLSSRLVRLLRAKADNPARAQARRSSATPEGHRTVPHRAHVLRRR